MSQFKIGLTGGIGSGKTTVANLFEQQGITLVDADIIAREVVEPGSLGLSAIVNKYTDKILQHDGTLDRRKLRELIFKNADEIKWLNELLHPLIRQQMLKQVDEAHSEYVILVVPLLFENELDTLTDLSVLVDIPPGLQIARTAIRDNVDESEVKNIINNQMSREDKLARADYVIDNQGDLVQLKHQVTQLHKKFLQQAKLSSGND